MTKDKYKADAKLAFDPNLYNVKAAELARKATYPDMNEDQQVLVRQAVEKFIRTRGFTVGDVIKILSKGFGPERAQSVAITEITRAYAAAAQSEGEELKREFPGVRVVKRWFTNNDHLVCETCRSLEGSDVAIDREFAEGIPFPPAHEGCRCWMDATTDILGSSG